MKNKAKVILVAATKNQHKLAEIRKILRGSGIAVKSLSAFPPIPEVIENGKTLEANAAKKAEAVVKAFNCPALADDSGLFVPALNGQPGVKSARYAGPVCDYSANNRKLLQHMRGLQGKERRAYFATAVALSLPGKQTIIRTGKIWGTITKIARGDNGFGYDPIFKPRGRQKTFAEMKSSEKNKISHRALALKKIALVVKKRCGQ